MQVCRIQPEIETALREVARGKKKNFQVSHSGKQRKSIYGGWECEIKDNRSSSRKETQNAANNAEAAATMAQSATSESMLDISSSILKYLWLFSLSQTFVESF